MNYAYVAKFTAGAAMLGSVFALVVLGKVGADQYLGLVGQALAGLGVGAAVAFQVKPSA